MMLIMIVKIVFVNSISKQFLPKTAHLKSTINKKNEN